MRCKESGISFEITDADRAFYQRMGVPEPRLCPEERRRRRLVFRNERNLYRRACDATGKMIVTIHDEDAPFPVYSQDAWWSDSWNALSFGQEIDFSRPFFEQFAKLFHAVPQAALKAPRSENSEYTNQCENNRDCYLVFCSNASRNCYHGMWYQGCTDCIDCLYLESSELCYEILNGENCYHSFFCENVQNCSDCYFCFDCIGCKSCIGCSNLRNKTYCIENVQYSKKEFEARVQALGLGRRSALTQLAQRYQERFSKTPRKYFVGKNCEEFSGNYLNNVKQAYYCYNCRHCERIQYCHDAWEARNCYDLTETLATDFCIELEGSERCNDIGFSKKMSLSADAWYSTHCYSSKDLFGCVGIKNKQFCILNKQYSREQYTALRAELVAHMKQTGEWGNYFPTWLAPFPYNKTVAQEYYPLTKEQALAQGFRWKDEDAPRDKSGSDQQFLEVAPAELGPEVLSHTFHCEQTARPFRITSAELKFHQRQGIALPSCCPDERHLQRMNRRAPRRLHERSCSTCHAPLLTSFDRLRSEQILCENCFDEADLHQHANSDT